MEKITVDDISSRAYRGLELFIIVPLLGLGLIGVGFLLLSVLPLGGDSIGFVGFVGVGYLLFGAVTLLSHIVSPILLYIDARQIRKADLEWKPSPVLNAIGAVFLSYLIILNYLYHRHQYVVDWVDRDWWVYLVAVGTVVPLLCTPLIVTADFQIIRTPFGTVYRNAAELFVPLALLILSAAAFQIAIYRDSTYARLNGTWQPNPATYLTIASFGVVLAPIVYPITGGYYLYKRTRSVGA